MTASLHCIRELVFGLACTFSQPHPYTVDQPQPFIYGRAVDYSAEDVSQIVWKADVPSPLDKPVMVAEALPVKPDAKPKPVPTFEALAQEPPKAKPIELPEAAKSPTLLDLFRRKKDDSPTTQLAFAGSGLEALSSASRARRYNSAPTGSMWALVDGNEDMGCVVKNKALMSAIRKVHDKYGKTVGIDSAYRSPAYNRGVNGAERSYHMSCKAVDIIVPGVGKDALKSFVRGLPEIGGVGIYNSGSIHMDTGPKRNWDWRNKRRASKPTLVNLERRSKNTKATRRRQGG